MDKFKKQLARQLKFMQNSCHLFDKGDWDEAIRIATSIRVIVHDTSSSTSILKHLEAKDINLFTVCPETPKGETNYVAITCFNMGVINMGVGGKYGYGPDLQDFSVDSSVVLLVDKWWNQVVWVLDLNTKLTRKDLVLGAANKDGGAHVDSVLEPKYEQLSKEDFGTIVVRIRGKEDRRSVTDMHLVSIRTIANELLKSTELLSLIQ